MPPVAMVLLVPFSVRPFDAMNGMLASLWPSGDLVWLLRGLSTMRSRKQRRQGDRGRPAADYAARLARIALVGTPVPRSLFPRRRESREHSYSPDTLRSSTPGSFLQRMEIGDHILTVGLIGEIDEHFCPVHDEISLRPGR